jgi:hypothetical protein
MATGDLPDVSSISAESISMGGGGAGIGTSLVFGNSSGFNNRKRSLEGFEEEWMTPGGTPGLVEVGEKREMKKMRG